jgi:LPPG:FO 2-phospho-L-lactate transferase
VSARVTVLTGGVGGAKLVHGLGLVMPPDQITAIVNTGDDFRHLGLPICPDIDTLLYTLSGKANRAQGWGREGESWSFMDALLSLGGPDWFKLGDGDLALHVLRLSGLADGATQSQITARFAQAWNIGMTILPMSDDPVATMLETSAGVLDFQHYFVRERCVPAVRRIWFDSAARASAAPGVIDAITGADIILIAPSNPWLSVDPILSVPQIRQALDEAHAPVVAVSPLVGGKAVKGPTAKIMQELGLDCTNEAVARHYGTLLDAMVINQGDAPAGGALPCAQTPTLMLSDEDRARVAAFTLDFGKKIKLDGYRSHPRP